MPVKLFNMKNLKFDYDLHRKHSFLLWLAKEIEVKSPMSKNFDWAHSRIQAMKQVWKNNNKAKLL